MTYILIGLYILIAFLIHHFVLDKEADLSTGMKVNSALFWLPILIIALSEALFELILD